MKHLRLIGEPEFALAFAEPLARGVASVAILVRHEIGQLSGFQAMASQTLTYGM